MIGDYKSIQKDVEDIITRSQSYHFPINCEKMMEQWYNAKKPIIDLFGGHLILRGKKVNVKLSEKQKELKFRNFLDTLEENNILNRKLEEFLLKNKEGFFNNKITSSSFGLKPGMKMLKSLKYLIDDTKVLRETQDLASQFIQEDKLEGYLYLSVDPRDFLTLSENNENWSSCHSLDGEYRGGNLSYMVDKTTIIAYLADCDDEHLKCLPRDKRWNSKKWRMLIHTDLENCIYYSRQYPYDSETLLNMVHTGLCFLFPEDKEEFLKPKKYGYNFLNDRIIETNQLYLGSRVFDTRDIIDYSDYTGYKDLIYSKAHQPTVSLSRKFLPIIQDMPNADYGYEKEESLMLKMFGIKIGEKVICPVCGREHIDCEDALMCGKCLSAVSENGEDFFTHCNECFHKIYEEDGEEIFELDGGHYCKKCYNLILKENEKCQNAETRLEKE